MSSYINENGDFTKFYGTSIISFVKNVEDLYPLMSILQTYPDIKLVKNITLKIFDVFSQTMASFVGDECGAITEWYNENGGIYRPYQFLDHSVILPRHYEAKSVLKELMPQDFCIMINPVIKIRTNRVVIEFELNSSHRYEFKKIITSLNDIYGVKRGIIRYIVLGYLKTAPFKFTETQLNLLNSMIPKKIYVNYPDIYQYNTIDSYKLYSSDMN